MGNGPDDEDKTEEKEKEEEAEEPGFKLDDVIKRAMTEEGPQKGKGPHEITRVSELVEGDFEIVSDDEQLSEKDVAIQDHIMDLEVDLEHKIALLDEEKIRSRDLEKKVIELKEELKKAKDRSALDETVQGYLADLEADIKGKIQELDEERTEKEKMEQDLARLRSDLERTSGRDEDLDRMKRELERVKVDGEVEIARLEEEHRRKKEETEELRSKVTYLENDILKRAGLIEQLRGKISETEATCIHFRQKVEELETQIGLERERGEKAKATAESLEKDLSKLKEALKARESEVKDIKTSTSELDDLKARLMETSARMIQEKDQREKAEKEIDQLRGRLSKVGAELETGIKELSHDKESIVEELGSEKRQRKELEMRIESLSEEVRRNEERANEERTRFLEEIRQKEEVLTTEMAQMEELKAQLAKERRELDEESNELEALRSRTDADIKKSRSEFSNVDMRLKAEFERLQKERAGIEARVEELALIEKRMEEKERAITKKELELKNELRAITLGLGKHDGQVTVQKSPKEEGAPKGPSRDMTQRTGLERPMGTATSSEAVAMERPKIWPPLGSMGGRVEEIQEDEPPPRRRPDREPPHKGPDGPRRSLLWPEWAYETEAKIENRPYVYGRSKETPEEDRPKVDRYYTSSDHRHRLLDDYVNVKETPPQQSRRPEVRTYRCMCGTEVILTDSQRKEGLRCPRCGKRLL